MRFRGKIIPGKGIGRKLGFPTLNLKPPVESENEAGVFAARIFLGKKTFPAILFLGNRQTFDNQRTLEVHILEDFKEQPKSIEFEILDKIREVVKFDSAEELKAQIEKDCARAREILGVR
ncbi:MAG: riboflavin kinase [Patescibacteria group bacterium]